MGSRENGFPWEGIWKVGGPSPAAFYFWTSYGRRPDYKEEGCQLVLHVSGRDGRRSVLHSVVHCELSRDLCSDSCLFWGEFGVTGEYGQVFYGRVD